MSPVPCSGCTACCRNGELVAVFEEEGDDVASYLTRTIQLGGDETGTIDGRAINGGMTITVLEHKPNGDCIYLGEGGCTIYDRRPAVCRKFDCRLFFKGHSRNERRVVERQAKQRSEIFAAGRARLKSLESV